MESENVQIVKNLYAAFNRGDINTILELISGHAVLLGTSFDELIWSGEFKGPTGAAEFIGRLHSALEVTDFEPERYISAGDDVISFGWWEGRSRMTGKSFRSDWAMRMTLRDGKLVFMRAYDDSANVAAACREMHRFAG